MAVGAGLGCAPLAKADEADDEMLSARFQKIFGRYCINDTLSSEDAAFVERHAIPADSDQARGTHILDTQDIYEGHPCSIRGNWYYDDCPEDKRWHVYGAAVQAVYPEGTAAEIIVGIRFMAFRREGLSYKLIWKDEQSESDESIGAYSSEFLGQYMGDVTYLAASCFATFKSQSHLLTPFMAGTPFILSSAGVYSTNEIPVASHLYISSPE